MHILGLSCYYHDAAACLLVDGKLVSAVEEERLTRQKHDHRFPQNSIRFCLDQAGIEADQLDAVVFYEKPSRKLDRTLRVARQYPDSSEEMVGQQLRHLCHEGLFLNRVLQDKCGYGGPVFYCDHHMSHAASAFLASPYEHSAILTIDGVGDWATTGQFVGQGNAIRALRQIEFPHSLGLFYASLTAFLGFKVNNDEYKVMGLASYGQPRHLDRMRELIQLHEDGSYRLNLDYFSFMHDGQRMFSDRLIELLGPPRGADDRIEEYHIDLAASLQQITEDAVLGLVRSFEDIAEADNLCIAGGVGYNCVANSRIEERTRFKNLFIQPAAGDSGGALGAALYYWHSLGNGRSFSAFDPYLGPGFSNDEIRANLEARSLTYRHCPSEEDLCGRTADLICRDYIVGWFQGRMEFGPRALGARSILANPRSPEMKDILNARVKFREDFRPFAPAVLEERAADYFLLNSASPYMLLTPQVRPECAALIPSVTHADGTARVQTVSRAAAPRFHRLVSEVGARSGVPVVINTSFNIRGEPIVCTPQNAVTCFLTTDIDYLAIGDFIVSKSPGDPIW